MKLYELQHSQWVKLILPKPEKKEKEDNVRWEREKPKEEGIQVPSTAIPLDKDAIIFFDHVDGMYSLCWDTEGNMVHPAAWTEVGKSVV